MVKMGLKMPKVSIKIQSLNIDKIQRLNIIDIEVLSG
jgi:hypothetical protein